MLLSKTQKLSVAILLTFLVKMFLVSRWHIMAKLAEKHKVFDHIPAIVEQWNYMVLLKQDALSSARFTRNKWGPHQQLVAVF